MGSRKGGEEVVIVLDGSMNSGAYGSLAKTINEELQAIGVAVDDDMQEVFDEVGKEAVKRLRETSPVNEKGKHSGRYAKGWAYEKGKRYRGKSVGVVRNKTDPQLTHLLEYGHPIVRNGQTVGNYAGNDHIRKTAEWVAKEVENKLTKKLGGK